jgi:phage gp29-like protein
VAATDLKGDIFRSFLDYQDQLIVLAATGGKLTMLAESGSGTLAGNAHADTFAQIARNEAATISETFQSQIDSPALEAAFPDRPALAYFELAFRSEPDSSTVITQALQLSQAGYSIAASELSEKTGYTLSDRPQVAPPTYPSQSFQMSNRSRVVRNTTAAKSVVAPGESDIADWVGPMLNPLKKAEEILQQNDPKKVARELQELADSLAPSAALATPLADVLDRAMQKAMTQPGDTTP